jgi:hypothetical protein
MVVMMMMMMMTLGTSHIMRKVLEPETWFKRSTKGNRPVTINIIIIIIIIIINTGIL